MKRIAEFAASKLGCGYVYGATGWICSKARREQQAQQYPDQAGNILGVCAKWDGVQCYDCAQLTRFAAKAAGVVLPSGATSQWRSSVWEAKGEIASLPDEPGILLYRQSGEKMQHTGVYVGGGFVVEARGSSQGVIRSALSSYNWTHWGKVKIDEGADVDMDTELYKATVTKTAGAKGETVNLRDAPGGDRIDRVPFGTILSIYEDRDGWSLTQYNGVPGWMDASFLVRSDATDADGSPAEDDPEDGDELVTVSRAKLEAIYAAVGEMLEVWG
jgi:hypothetical protein